MSKRSVAQLPLPGIPQVEREHGYVVETYPTGYQRAYLAGSGQGRRETDSALSDRRALMVALQSARPSSDVESVQPPPIGQTTAATCCCPRCTPHIWPEKLRIAPAWPYCPAVPK